MWRCCRSWEKGIKLEEVSFRFGEERSDLIGGWRGVRVELGEYFSEIGGRHCRWVRNGRFGGLLVDGSNAECRFQVRE